MAHWFYSIRSISFHFFSLKFTVYCTVFYRCSGLYGLYPPPVYQLPGPTYVHHDLSFTDVLASTASILHLCIISLDLPMNFMTSILQMFWPLRPPSSTCVSSPWTYLCTSWPLFYRCSGLYGFYPPPVYHLLGSVLGYHQPLLLPHQDERQVRNPPNSGKIERGAKVVV